MNLQEIKSQFDEMNEEQQWAWLVATDLKDSFRLFLDNDNTSILFNDDEEAEHVLYFKADIGDRSGLDFLLKSIGVTAEGV